MKQTVKSGFWVQAREFAVLLLIAGLIRTFGFGLYQVPTGSMETTMLVGERFFADKFTIHFSSLKNGDIISFNDPLFEYSKNPLINVFQRYVGVPQGGLSWGPQNWTKRIIGIPGDRVSGVIEDGKPAVYLNGKKLDEPYLNKYPLIYASVMGTQRSYDPSRPFDQQPFYNMDPYEVQKAIRFFERRGRSPIVNPGTPIEGQGSDVFDIHLGPNQYWVMGDNRLGSLDSRAWGPLDGKLIHGKIIWRIFSVDSDDSWWVFDLLKHPIDFWKRVRWSRCFQSVR